MQYRIVLLLALWACAGTSALATDPVLSSGAGRFRTPVDSTEYLRRVDSLSRGVDASVLADRAADLVQFLRSSIVGGDHPALVTALLAEARFHSATRTLSKAGPHLEEAVAIARRLYANDHEDLRQALTGLATFYAEVGRYTDAAPLWEEALAMTRRLYNGDRPLLAVQLGETATFFATTGRHAEAEPLFVEALEMQRRLHPDGGQEVAAALNNLGRFIQHRGRHEQAEKYFREALDMRLRIDGTDDPTVIEGMSELALLLQEHGRLAEARPLFEQALETARRVYPGMHQILARAIQNMAGYHEQAGAVVEAEALYREALSMRKILFVGDHPELAHSYLALGQLEAGRGNDSLAERLLGQALAMTERLYTTDHEDIVAATVAMIKFHDSRGRLELALPLAIKLAGRIRNQCAYSARFESEDEQLRFQRTLAPRLDYLYSLFLRSGKAGLVLVSPEGTELYNLSGELWNLALASKANILESAGAQRRAIERLGSSDPEVNAVMLRFRESRVRLARLYATPPRDSTASITWKQEVARLEADVNAVEKQLARHSAVYSDAARVVTWQDVQAGLGDGEAAIEYLMFEYHVGTQPTDSVQYVALLLRKGDAQPHIFEIASEATLASLVAAEVEPPTKRGRVARPDPSTADTRRVQLSELLWNPMLPKLTGITRLALSPVGILNRVSFAALADGSGGYLTDRYSFRMMASSKGLAFATPRRKTTGGLTALLVGGAKFGEHEPSAADLAAGVKPAGRPSHSRGIREQEMSFSYTRGEGITWGYLPGTRTEVDTLARMFKRQQWNVTRLTGDSAREETVKATTAPRVLHVATHGFFFPPVPEGATVDPRLHGYAFRTSPNPMMRNGLILTGGNRSWTLGQSRDANSDGVMTAFEIAHLDLTGTELVVLSACETGLGDIEGDEGVFGLQRAFIMAGADAVVSSLWKVPDAQTVELMTEFYSRFLRGANRQEAFADAQRVLRKKYAPYYWAAFVMVER